MTQKSERTITVEDVQEITINAAQEKIVSSRSREQVEAAVNKLFRHPAKRMLIPAFKGSNPAFEYWVDRLKKGERLPRGKYFRICERIQAF